MQKVRLGEALEVSQLIYGMWRLADDADTSPAAVQAKIETCLAAGITSFDQADIYGEYGGEAILGACLKTAPHLRDKMQIITKCDIIMPFGKYASARVKHYDTSRAHILNSVEASLKNMHLGEIDLLLLHRPDPLMDHRETGATLDQLVASGKVRAVGVSNFRPHDVSLLQSAMQSPLIANQIELSVTATQSFTNGDLAFLQERDIRPMAWSPLGGGALFGDAATPLTRALDLAAQRFDTDRANAALAWLLRHPAGILPVLGTNRLARIEKMAQSVEIEMDRETWFEIYEASIGHPVD